MKALSYARNGSAAPGSGNARMQPRTPPAAQRPMRADCRTQAATANTEAAITAAVLAAAPVPVAADSSLPPEQIQQVCQLLESSLQQPAAAVVKQIVPRHQWGQGLSAKGFAAALQALPLQQKLRWKSLYPAIGTGSRGKVYQAVNLDTGESTLKPTLCHTSSPGAARSPKLFQYAVCISVSMRAVYTDVWLW